MLDPVVAEAAGRPNNLNPNNGDTVKKLTTIVALAATMTLTGCASQGEGQNFAQNFGNSVKGAATSVGDGIGKAVNGVFQPYTNGVEVTQQQLAQLEKGMSPEQVEQIIGYPPEISEVSGGELWSYPFTKITHFSGNTSETTVVRFKDGKLAKAYKTSGRNSSTGNPLVDAANGVN